MFICCWLQLDYALDSKFNKVKTIIFAIALLVYAWTNYFENSQLITVSNSFEKSSSRLL